MKSIIQLIIIFFLCSQIVDAQTAVPPSAGDGTKENPYQIATLGNLYWLATDYHYTGYPQPHYLQVSDINAAETSEWFGGSGWPSMGSLDTSFTIIYDGGGHIIDSLFINRPSDDFSGFAACTYFGEIKNLGITNARITGGPNVGTLAGLNNYTRLENCFSSGSITGTYGVGGICGTNDHGLIINNYSNAAAEGINGVGGLIGRSRKGYIFNCYSSGAVNGTSNFGGLYGTELDEAAEVFYSFWDIQTSGQNGSAGGIGKTTTEMKTSSTFSDYGWMSGIWYMDAVVNDGYPYLRWQNPAGTPLPDGPAEMPAAGDGSEENPYELSTLGNLYWIIMDPSNLNKYYIQTADIDASDASDWISGSGWIPIGNVAYEFNGIYNGKGHVVSGISINRPNNSGQGFFGYIYGAEIDSVGVTGANITGLSYTGALVGQNRYSLIRSCFTTGSVNGLGQYTGGLVGNNSDNSSIINCYSRTNVIGVLQAGGLAGSNSGSLITSSYSTGLVNASTEGGLVALNGGNIVNCFWDIEASGLSSSGGGYGRTTSEMKKGSTFSLLGWNKTAWFIDDGINDGYPYLSWQNPGGTPLPDGLASAPSNGDGTTGNPYQIESLGNLFWIVLNPGNWNKNYIQTADINTSAIINFTEKGWPIPIGNPEAKFTGSYNGNGYNIDSLFINYPAADYQGLFGYISNAVLDSINLTNININGGSYIGSLAGVNLNSLINNCHSSGIIKGKVFVGGLFGSNNTSVVNSCIFNGDIVADSLAGGLTGENRNGSAISLSLTSGNISGVNTIGGLTGFNEYSVIRNSYSNSIVNASGNYSGGIAGKIKYESSIDSCYSLGRIIGKNFTGGLIGFLEEGNVNYCYSNSEVDGTTNTGGLIGYMHSSSIRNNYSRGKIAGTDNTGGLIGSLSSSVIQNSYSTGTVSGYTPGGLAGAADHSDILECFWDKESSGILVSAGGIGKTTSAMKSGLIFQDAGWNNSIWFMDNNVNDGYPYLNYQNPAGTPFPLITYAEPPLSGDGTEVNPYQILSVKNLYWIAENKNKLDDNFIQTADINAAETANWFDSTGWKRIGDNVNPFTGSYNGKGFKIDSLKINRPGADFLGLFGYTSGASIDSVIITNSSVTGKSFLGSLIGSCQNTIVNHCRSIQVINGYDEDIGGLIGLLGDLSILNDSYSSGTVEGHGAVGGLTGEVNNSIINRSFSTATITGFSYVGGLAGILYQGEIHNSYSRGNISGTGEFIGGLLGRCDFSLITDCYSTGSITGNGSETGGLIGSVNDLIIQGSFWDREASGIPSSAAGIGKTTVQMKTYSTFIDAGWSPAIWFKDDSMNNSYPYLFWQNPGGTPLAVEETDQLPVEFKLSQNYPNPFNPVTTIKFSVPVTGYVALKVYNILGKELTAIVNGEYAPGNYKIDFNAEGYASGVYFYKLNAGSFTETKKFIILK